MDLVPPPLVVIAAEWTPLSRQHAPHPQVCIRLIHVLAAPRRDLIADLLRLRRDSEELHVLVGIT
jgi:hypothetical protein